MGEEALAQDKIGVWQVGQRFEQDQVDNVAAVQGRSELVKPQHTQISFQVVNVILCLHFDIPFQLLQVIRVIPY